MEETNENITKSTISFFVIAFGISWLFWLLGIFTTYEIISISVPNMVFVIIGVHGPLVAAIILTRKISGWAGVKKLLLSGFNIRIKPYMWLMTIILPIVLSGIAVWINTVMSEFEFDKTLISRPILIIPTFLMMFFLGGSFQEEYGWRGYALPRMLKKWNPLLSSVILGGIWGIWHLPLFFISGTSQVYMSFSVFFILTIALSFLFTWCYLKTARNIFSALLLHTGINTSLSIFPPIEMFEGGNQMAFSYLMILYVFVAVFLLLKERSWWTSVA